MVHDIPQPFYSLVGNHSNQRIEEEGEENEQEIVLVGRESVDTGAMMGVYNAAIAAPQILAAMGSSGMFWILKERGWEDNEAAGWVIRIGGLAGILAAWLTVRIK